ncbi:unnamed protein product, partial [marine sediment metagenome]
MNITILDKATISDRTKRDYIRFIKNIQKVDIDVKITDINKVHTIIKSITSNPNSQGSYFSAVMKILELSNNNELRKKYKDLLKETIKKHDNTPKKLTKPQKKVISRNYEKLKHDFVISSKKKGIDKLSEIEFVLLFYVLLPPRRSDYYNMIYTTHNSKTKNEEHNYLLDEDTGYTLVFNKFKNVKKIGSQRFRIGSSRKERSLRRIISNRKLQEGQSIYSKSRRYFT